MKCELCNKEIEELFLGKIKGTIVKINKDNKNTQYTVCNECQQKNKDVKALLTQK